MRKTILLRLIIFVLAVLVAIPMFMLGKYYFYQNKLDESIERNDAEDARVHIVEVQYYYNLARRVPFGEYFADQYLFQDAWYHRALHDKVIGDYDNIIKENEGRQDWRAQQLVCIAYFMNAREEFQSADNPEKKNEILSKVLIEISPYCERSLRLMPESAHYMNKNLAKWNYDLTSDPEKAAAALAAPQKGPPNFILGIPGGEGDMDLKGKGEDGYEDLFDTAEPEEGNPKNKKKS